MGFSLILLIGTMKRTVLGTMTTMTMKSISNIMGQQIGLQTQMGGVGGLKQTMY
jgi:hypothetical protein